MHLTKTGIVLVSVAIACFAFTNGCSSGGSDVGGEGGSPDGVVSAAITDAPSDEIESFVVDVTALQLKKLDGAVVSVISSPVTVDLATLTDTTQLLNMVNVPIGIYTSATITLDFTNASCVLVGQSTPAAILDDTGTPVTGALALPVHFEGSPLHVLVDKHKLLEFDFDLNHSADVDSVANTVKLEPVFALHMDGSGKKVETLGALVSVSTSGLSFVGNVKTLHGVVLGNVSYTTDSNTIFQVDGVPATGATGLALLNAKPAGTWIQVYGQIDGNAPAIDATYVEAGTGTYNGGTDIVEGHVIDRVGNPSAGSDVTLTVLGRSNNSSHTVFQYNTTFTVTTHFANTKVVHRYSAQAFDTDDVNVGQRVRIFGSLSGTSMNATLSTDVIRAQESRAFGYAGGAIAAGTLTLDLHHVDLRPQNLFTWTDSGTTAPVPTAFTANVGTLGNTLGVTSGTAIEARGFFAPIDDNNQDLAATTLINLDAAPSMLFVKNLSGGFAVNLTTSSSEIQIGISGVAGTGEKAIVDHGYAGIVQLPASPTPTVQPAAAGVYMIHDKVTGMVTAYLAFDVFSTALGNALSAGATVGTFSATGVYTASSNTMQATFVSVIVH